MSTLGISAQDWKVLGVAAHVSLSGLLYGLDTGSIGPITAMPQFEASMGPLTPSQQGIYVACVLLSAALSSLASGSISDAISRKYAILAGSLVSVVGTVLSSASPNWAGLVAARIISGAGFGQCMAVSTVYLVELAPTHIRGVCACMVQLFVVLGITVGYFVCFGTQELEGSVAWRVPFAVQAACAALLAAGMVAVPFSPRWLLAKGRRDEAVEVLKRYCEGGVEVEAKVRELEASLREREARREDGTGWKMMWQRRYVGRTSLGIFLMAAQQMTGIDAVLYYAPILFHHAGLTSTRASFLASGVTGIVMLAATLPAQVWIDKWGRKGPLVYGGAGMVACLCVIGSLYARFGERNGGEVSIHSEVGSWCIIVMIYLFVVNFSWSWAVVGKIYTVEIIPTHLRAKVAAVELLANWLVNFGVALTAPIFLRASPSGPYFLYGAVTAVAVVVCIFMPETKGKSLEEIEKDFEKSREPGGGAAMATGACETPSGFWARRSQAISGRVRRHG